MDPISLTALMAVALSAVSFSNTLFAALKASTSVKDDRYDEIYWRVFAEKERTVAWVRRMAWAGFEPPLQHREQFGFLLTGLADRYKDMERKLEKLYADPDEKKRPESKDPVIFARRLRFHIHGFNELKQTLEAVSAMNNALDILGPQLPEYSKADPLTQLPGSKIRSTPQIIGPRVSEKTTSGATSFSHDLVVEAAPTTTTPRMPAPTAGAKNSTTRQPSAKVQSPKIIPYPLYAAHRVAVSALNILHNAGVENCDLSGLGPRLELWGQGVFRRDADFAPLLDLEHIVAETAETTGKCLLGYVVLGNLVGILVGAVPLLERVRDETEYLGRFPSDHEDAMAQILVTLAQPQLREIARVRYEELYISNTDTEWIDDEDNFGWDGVGDDHDEVEESDLESDGSALSTKSCTQYIRVAVNCLFALLPAIHSCQQSHRLELEAQHSATVAEKTLKDEIVQQTTHAKLPQYELSEPAGKDSGDSIADNGPLPTPPPMGIDIKIHTKLVGINLDLATDFADIISKEELVGPLAGTLSHVHSTLQKEIEQLGTYRDGLAASGRETITTGESQAALEQNGTALRMAHALYDELKRSSRIKPTWTGSHSQTMSRAESDRIAQSIQNKFEGMLEEFQSNNKKLRLIAQDRGIHSGLMLTATT